MSGGRLKGRCGRGYQAGHPPADTVTSSIMYADDFWICVTGLYRKAVLKSDGRGWKGEHPVPAVAWRPFEPEMRLGMRIRAFRLHFAGSTASPDGLSCPSLSAQSRRSSLGLRIRTQVCASMRFLSRCMAVGPSATPPSSTSFRAASASCRKWARVRSTSAGGILSRSSSLSPS